MKKFCTVLLTIIIAIISANAKTSEQIVPVDTALRQGILPNGMTYYVRKAVNKKHIGEFRLIQRTGSLVEEDTSAFVCEEDPLPIDESSCIERDSLGIPMGQSMPEIKERGV